MFPQSGDPRYEAPHRRWVRLSPTMTLVEPHCNDRSTVTSFASVQPSRIAAVTQSL